MIRAPLDLGIEVALRIVLAPCVVAARWSTGVATVRPAEAPVATVSLAAAARAGLDEIFFLTEVLSARFVTGADRARLCDEIARALELFGVRGWFDTPATYHRTPDFPEDVRITASRSLGRRFGHLTFMSGYEPHAGEPGHERWLGYVPNRMMHARLLEHAGPSRPWLVCLPGYRTGFAVTDLAQFPPAWLHQELGLNVCILVPPLHGPRTVGRRSGEGFASGDLFDMIHLQAQATWDLRRLLLWLRAARGATAIGVYGLSLGGTTAALTAGLEPDLACVIAGMSPVDLVGIARHHVPAFLLALAERAGIAWDSVGRLLQVVSPLHLAPRVPHGRRFVFGGTHDRLVPAAQICALWRHWDEPNLAWHAGSHVSFTFELSGRAVIERALRASALVD